MVRQLSLFEEFEELPQEFAKCFHRNIKDSGFDYQEIDIGDITFKAGQCEAVHRWYRLTPSYAPSLVRFFLQGFNVDQDRLVFDPFSGRGTTTIECQKQGVRSLGMEINPLLQQVGSKSLVWTLDNHELLDAYLKDVSNLLKKHKPDSIDDIVHKLNTQIPIIHNVFRWWQPEVLKELIICREVMKHENYTPVSGYLWLALNKASLDCANIHRNHPTITFDDNHTRDINVYFEVSQNLGMIKEDLSSLSQAEINYSGLNSIILGDSTSDFREKLTRTIDVVITSPPYPNRYSYIHQTRPQLHFMELLDNVKQATEIDLNAIGGTWGRATSILQNELIKVPPDLQSCLEYYNELKDKSVLMCNYATKYFIDLQKHIRILKQVISPDFKGAYIVGNSRLSGVEIFTETILGKIFEQEGFEVEKIIAFRKRGGKKRLYETALCVKKQTPYNH